MLQFEREEILPPFVLIFRNVQLRKMNILRNLEEGKGSPSSLHRYSQGSQSISADLQQKFPWKAFEGFPGVFFSRDNNISPRARDLYNKYKYT